MYSDEFHYCSEDKYLMIQVLLTRYNNYIQNKIGKQLFLNNSSLHSQGGGRGEGAMIPALRSPDLVIYMIASHFPYLRQYIHRCFSNLTCQCFQNKVFKYNLLIHTQTHQCLMQERGCPLRALVLPGCCSGSELLLESYTSSSVSHMTFSQTHGQFCKKYKKM